MKLTKAQKHKLIKMRANGAILKSLLHPLIANNMIEIGLIAEVEDYYELTELGKTINLKTHVEQSVLRSVRTDSPERT